MFINPYVTTTRAALKLGVSLPTAQKSIDRLIAVGMLKESTGREWGRMWLAGPILTAVNQFLTSRNLAKSSGSRIRSIPARLYRR